MQATWLLLLSLLACRGGSADTASDSDSVSSGDDTSGDSDATDTASTTRDPDWAHDAACAGTLPVVLVRPGQVIVDFGGLAVDEQGFPMQPSDVQEVFIVAYQQPQATFLDYLCDPGPQQADVTAFGSIESPSGTMIVLGGDGPDASGLAAQPGGETLLFLDGGTETGRTELWTVVLMTDDDGVSSVTLPP
jgi:hypothetical protein